MTFRTVGTKAVEALYLVLDAAPLAKPAQKALVHTEPAADCCNGVFGWWGDIYMSTGFERQTGSAELGGHPSAPLNFRLFRPYEIGLDPKKRGAAAFPERSAEQAMAEALLEDARLWLCEGRRAINTLFGDERLRWGDMKPLPPRGRCAGWSWQVTVSLDWPFLRET